MFSTGDIEARIKQLHFVPFRVKTSDGEAYDVFRPDLLMIGRREIMIGIGASHDSTIYDRLARVAIMHITAIEDLPATKPPSSNGEH